MKRTLFFGIGILLLVSNCNGPKQITTSDHLFSDVDGLYRLSDYNVVLKTRDSVFYLSNPTILSDGKLEAERKYVKEEGKRVIFYSTKNSEKVVLREADSVGLQPSHIRFSKENISQVIVMDDTKGTNRKVIYADNTSNIVVMMSTLGITLLMIVGVVLAVGLFFSALFAALGSCYIATMVYKSYDAPEVLILRRYRDEKLATHLPGRVFIKVYYLLSPVFVRIFKNNKPVNKAIKWVLDRWVKQLEKKQFCTS